MKCNLCLREPKGYKDKQGWDVDDVCPECLNTPADRRLGQLLEEYIQSKKVSIEAGRRVEHYSTEKEDELISLLRKDKDG